MQLVRAVLAATLANAACTDGVGVPIREELERDGDAGPSGDVGSGIPRSCADWLSTVANSERELLDRVNARRMQGECAGQQFEPRPPLRPAPELQCVARLHSVDLAVNRRLWDDQDENGSIGSEGTDPRERIEAVGFGGDLGESRVRGEFSAMEAFDDLVERTSNGCRNLSQPSFTYIGVGRYDGFWTLDFAEYEPGDGTGGP